MLGFLQILGQYDLQTRGEREPQLGIADVLNGDCSSSVRLNLQYSKALLMHTETGSCILHAQK